MRPYKFESYTITLSNTNGAAKKGTDPIGFLKAKNGLWPVLFRFCLFLRHMVRFRCNVVHLAADGVDETI